MLIRAATRASPLARWQTAHVGRLLAQATGGEVQWQEVLTDTVGDRRQDVPIHQIGGQGVFAKEVQAAVLEGRADVAVHSAKDLPPRSAPGLVLAAVPPRGDPRDALVGRTLDSLPAGARVATGSVRRRAQLAWLRPDLSFTNLRGNIATRLSRLDQVDALVMAQAALVRLELEADRVVDVLEPEILLPQVGQGALAVECREDDGAVAEVLAGIQDAEARRQVEAERAFLNHLGGACDLPVGAFCRPGPDAELLLEGLIASGDGRVVLRQRRRGGADDPVGLGRALAAELLAQGGADLLGRT